MTSIPGLSGVSAVHARAEVLQAKQSPWPVASGLGHIQSLGQAWPGASLALELKGLP